MSWHPLDGDEQASARPRSKIVGKDGPRERIESIVTLPDGRIAVGYGGIYAGSIRGLQIRSSETLGLLLDVPGLAPKHCFRSDYERLLTAGPLHEGQQSCMRLVDCENWEIADEFPLPYPFGWLPDGRILASTPAPKFHSNEKGFWYEGVHATEENLERHPWLSDLVYEKDTLLVIDVENRIAKKLTEDLLHLDKEWNELRELTIDERQVYYGTESTIGAVDINSGVIIWQIHMARDEGWEHYSPQSMAISPDGKLLAIGAFCARDVHDNVLILEAATGKTVLSVSFDSSINVVAWHPSGWLAIGSGDGLIRGLTMDGSFRVWKGATRAVHAICFDKDATQMLVGGSEKQLRRWQLLDDEINASV